MQVAQHLDARGRLQRDEFKVVYVAPMKALAAEVTGAFSKRLQPLGEPQVYHLNYIGCLGRPGSHMSLAPFSSACSPWVSCWSAAA